ncbi:MAG: LytTR family DNA-binding domain-containing protein [Eubacteriales bacterium]|nr:LytTR family DNA-binding domain-containing protein [Eubacteriales bacterium]
MYNKDFNHVTAAVDNGIVNSREYERKYGKRILKADLQYIFQEQNIAVITVRITEQDRENYYVAKNSILLVWVRRVDQWEIMHVHSAILPVDSRKLCFSGEWGSVYLLSPREILYVEARNMNSVIYYGTQEMEIHEQLSACQKRLPEYFVRVHRGYLVNAYCVLRFEKYCMLLANGVTLPIPQKRYVEVKEKLDMVLTGKKGCT